MRRPRKLTITCTATGKDVATNEIMRLICQSMEREFTKASQNKTVEKKG